MEQTGDSGPQRFASALGKTGFSRQPLQLPRLHAQREIRAAAGGPFHVFATTAEELLLHSHGVRAEIKQ